MTTCKWPTKPLSLVQVTVGETSMMATPERAYFDAATVNEAVMAERERCAAPLEEAAAWLLKPKRTNEVDRHVSSILTMHAARIRGA